MSKINLKMNLTSKEANYEYNGKAILTNNKITFNDNGVITIITLKPSISLERKKDYYIKLNFQTNKTLKGTYNTKALSVNIKTETKIIKTSKNNVYIEYYLILDETEKQKFSLNFNYSID